MVATGLILGRVPEQQDGHVEASGAAHSPQNFIGAGTGNAACRDLRVMIVRGAAGP